MQDWQHALTSKYSKEEYGRFIEIIQMLSQGNIEASRKLFSPLNANEINRFHAFRKDVRALQKLEKVAN